MVQWHAGLRGSELVRFLLGRKQLCQPLLAWNIQQGPGSTKIFTNWSLGRKTQLFGLPFRIIRYSRCHVLFCRSFLPFPPVCRERGRSYSYVARLPPRILVKNAITKIRFKFCESWVEFCPPNAVEKNRKAGCDAEKKLLLHTNLGNFQF